MERSGIFNDLEFYCIIHKTRLTKYQLPFHLSSSPNHKIRKNSHPRILPKSYLNTILDRIQAIINIKLEVQKSSAYFQDIILKNTEATILKLDILIRGYKDVIETGIINQELASKEVVKNYQLDESISLSLAKHFNKQLVYEGWSIITESKKAKHVVNDLLKNYTDCFECITGSSNGKFFLTGEANGAIKIWDYQNYSQIFSFSKHKARVTSLAIGLDNNKLLSGSSDCTLRLWDLNHREHLCKFEGHEIDICAVLISNDGNTGFSGSADCSVRVWNLETYELKSTINFSYAIASIRLISEDNTLVAASNGVISFYDLKNSFNNETRINTNNQISSMQLNENETDLILGYEDGSIQIYETSTFNLSFEAKEHTNSIRKIEFISKSNLFATSSLDHKLVIWDSIKKLLLKAFDFQSKVAGTVFLITSYSLVICLSYEIAMLDLHTYDLEIKLKTPSLSFTSLAVSSNLKFVAHGINEIALLDIEKNKELGRSSPFEGSIKSLVFSKKLSFVACADTNGFVTILKFPSLKLSQHLNLNLKTANYITFSENEKLIGITNQDTNLIVYNIERKLAVLNIKNVNVKTAVFCSNDEVFVYSVFKSVHILNKYFDELRVINYDISVEKMIGTEEGLNLMLNFENTRWSCLNMATFEYVYEDKSIKSVKEWVEKQLDRSSLAKLIYNR